MAGSPTSSVNEDQLFVKRGVICLKNVQCRATLEADLDDALYILRWVVTDVQVDEPDELGEPTSMRKMNDAFLNQVEDDEYGVVGPDYLLRTTIRCGICFTSIDTGESLRHFLTHSISNEEVILYMGHMENNQEELICFFRIAENSKPGGNQENQAPKLTNYLLDPRLLVSRNFLLDRNASLDAVVSNRHVSSYDDILRDYLDEGVLNHFRFSFLSKQY